jgi:hypothetical protein
MKCVATIKNRNVVIWEWDDRDNPYLAEFMYPQPHNPTQNPVNYDG